MQDLTPSEMDALARILGTPVGGEDKQGNRTARGPISRLQLTQIEENQGEETAESLLKSMEDVKIKIEVFLGKTKIPLGKLLKLKNGETIPLENQAGELLEIQANGKTIARGEAVVIDNNLGIRILEIINE